MASGLVRLGLLRALQWARSRSVRATLFYCALALVVARHGLLGEGTIGPDALLDQDRFFLGKTDPILKVGDYTPILLDQPRDLLFSKGLHLGRFDTWNPLGSCGAPLWAEQGGPFPFKLPFYIWPDYRAYNWFRAMRLVVAGLGAYLLARRRGITEGAALCSGGLFEISGPIIGHAPFASTSATCLLPWAIAAADAIARDGSRSAVAAGALVLGLAGWGGHPEINALAYLGFGAALLGYALTEPFAAPRMLLRGGLAVVLGVALSAPTLLPLGELIREGQSYKSAAKGEDIWETDLKIYNDSLPSALFAPSALMSMRDALGRWFPYMFFPTIGVAGLVLAILGASVGGAGLPLFLCAIIGTGLATAAPGTRWLHDLPVLKFILPRYAWPLVVLPLSQWAGTGIMALAQRRGLPRLVLTLVGLTAVAAAIWAYLPLDAGSKASLSIVGKLALLTDEGRRRLFGPPGVVLTIAVVSFLTTLKWPRSGAALMGAIALAEATLTMSSYLVDPTSEVLGRPAKKAVAFLQGRLSQRNARMLAMPFRLAWPNTPFLYGLADFRTAAAVPLRRFVMYKDLIDATPGMTGTYHTVTVAVSPLLDLAGVRYVVTQRYFPPTLLDRDPQGELAYRDSDLRILENRAAVPRVWLTHGARAVDNEHVARVEISRRIRAVPGKHAREAGLLDTVFLERSADGSEPPDLAGGAAAADEAVVVTPVADPDEVRVTANLTTPGYVVLADSYYPGWRAFVNGVERPIYPADILFRAVFLPAGRHTVTFRYSSPALRLGLAIALAASAVCAMLLVRRRT